MSRVCEWWKSMEKEGTGTESYLGSAGMGSGITRPADARQHWKGRSCSLSDKIAYINHDIDDAIRGGILREEDIPKKYTDVLGTSAKGRLNTLVHNVIINSVDRPVIQMSEEVHEAMQGLRVFMFENVYRNPVAKEEEGKAIHMITNLYEYLYKESGVSAGAII